MKKLFAVIALVLFMSMAVTAEEPAGMPPMGPPPEMKLLAGFVGTWDVDMEWRMGPESEEWVKSPGVAEYKFVLNGAALEMVYTSMDKAMPFTGFFLQSFDRHTKKYQSVWIDDMSARMSYYTGTREGEKTVMSGEEIMPDGKTGMARITTYNETTVAFGWMMEMSIDGGKTWWVSGKAKYTKRQ